MIPIRFFFCVVLFIISVLQVRLNAQVLINEIHYHPVEQSVFDGSVGRTFDASGNTIYSDTLAPADYSADIHEFIEIYNAGTASVDLSGWRFSQGVAFTFPNGTTLVPGAYKVIAKNPARIQSVYGINGVLGPYAGKLSNDGDTITLINGSNAISDSVTYSAHFPWAQSADGLGVSKDWLGFDPVTNQYKGRSLQRVSLTASSNDPANWIASPLNPGPTPGAANASTGLVPKPVVVAFSVAQSLDGSPTIRPANAVTVSATFSSTASLSAVQAEYFVDNINSFAETRAAVNLVETPAGSGQYVGTIPGQAARSIVRYRFKANRGAGVEAVSPRADDPQIVPVTATTKEGWHSYFVSPVRVSAKPIYDCFVSNASLAILSTNINQSPSRRITAEGNPREVPYVLPTAPQWNGVQPGIVVHNGVVYDIMFRHHGSRYRRGEGRQSYKWQFPRTNLFQGTIQEIFETDKARDTGNHPNTEWAHAIYRAAGIPTSYTQHVDLYLNGNGVIEQLEQSVCDDRLLERYYHDLYKLDRSQPELLPGDVYKCKSTDEGSNGPYVSYTGQKLTTNRTSTTGNVWTPLHQYRWNLTMQNNDWKGWKPLKDMVDAMWTAKNTNNTTTIRAWLASNWDVDKTLTEIAIRNWSCCWDDSFHNYYVYRQANGKWTMLPWDFDYEFADKSASSDIYTTSGNTFKDIFINNYRSEYKQKLWLLNNTLLAPASLAAMGINFGIWNTDRQTYVNNTLGLGVFQRPSQPVAMSPSGSAGAISPAALTASAYSHTSSSISGVSAHAKSKWEIRDAAGAYTDPRYSVTSTVNRTSLPIPFAELTLGQTYFWRVTYYDAQDHPSFTSDEASFIYGAGPVTENPIVMDASTQWKYNTSIQPTVTVWTDKTFNDSGWLAGPAPLGYSTSTTLPVPIRTDLGATTRVTCYFRKEFTYNGPLGPGTTLKLRQYIDDGVIFYLNGQELQRTRIGTGFSDQYTQTANAVVVGAVLEPSASAWFTVPSTALQSGTNVLAASVHQAANETTDYIFGAELQISYIPLGGGVVINEICADNHSIISNGGAYPDYVELSNPSSADVDLSGFGLTDDPLVPRKFVFPNNTIIAAGAYLVIWCDHDLTAPGLHAGFALNNGGQSLALFNNATARALVDYVTFGLQATDLPIGRVPNGTGAFGLVAASPGASNVARTTGSATNLRVNEWMAVPASGEDWFEIYNLDPNPVALAGLYLSDDPSQLRITRIPALSFIAGKGWQKFSADGSTDGGNHCNFKLSAGGEPILLTSTDGVSVLNKAEFGAQIQGVSQGRLPDGAASFASFPQSSSPGSSNWLPGPVVINEALTNSTPPLEDAIELLNPTNSSVDAGGWWLSDDASNLKKFQIPASTVIAAGGYLVIYENQFNPTPGIGNSFSLSSFGDELYLSAVDSTGNLNGYRAQVKFGAAADGISYGRIVTSAEPEFWPLVARSFGQDAPANAAQFRTGSGLPNAAPRTGPIIINEVMYHPVDIPGTPAVDNTLEEYVELHNITTTPQNLSGWKLKGNSDFTFSSGTIIRPGDYVLVVSFNPAVDAASLASFRSKYNLTSATAIYGPYQPKLANDAQNVEIAYPGVVENGVTPFILVDKVSYLDVSPWPSGADGLGLSLQRTSRGVIGNDPGNWTSSAPTPGAINYGQSAILDSDGDGLPDAWELANGFDRYDASDAALDADSDGQSNVAEYIAGTDVRNPASVLAAAASAAADGFHIRFNAAPNHGYSVLYSDAPGGPWIKLIDVSAQPSAMQQEVIDPAAVSKRFYKIVTPLQ